MRRNEIQEVELKKPGIFRVGYVKIRTIAEDEYKIGIIAGCKEEYEYLKEILQQLCPEKIRE